MSQMSLICPGDVLDIFLSCISPSIWTRFLSRRVRILEHTWDINRSITELYRAKITRMLGQIFDGEGYFSSGYELTVYDACKMPDGQIWARRSEALMLLALGIALGVIGSRQDDMRGIVFFKVTRS